MQKQDKSLSKWWQEAQEVDTEDADGQKARFEIKNGMLWRKKEVERRQVTQLVVPVPLWEKNHEIGPRWYHEWASGCEGDI